MKTNKLLLSIFLPAFLFGLFNTMPVFSQSNSLKNIETREQAKNNYLEAKSVLHSDSTKANFRAVVNNAEFLLAQDQRVLNDYVATKDSLHSMSLKLNILINESSSFKKELSHKSFYMVIYFTLGTLIAIFMIVFMVLFFSKNSKLKKVLTDFAGFEERERLLNNKIEELQRDLDKIKLDSEFRIKESEANYKNELIHLKARETDLLLLNSKLESQLNGCKEKDDDYNAKFNELKDNLEKEKSAKIELENKLKSLNNTTPNSSIIEELQNKLSEEQKLRADAENKLIHTASNVDENKLNELIQKNEMLHSETKLLMEKLTREVQLKQQLENQVTELKSLIHQHDEMASISSAQNERNTMSTELLEEKQKLSEYVVQLESDLKDEIQARTLLETEFHKILKELGGEE